MFERVVALPVRDMGRAVAEVMYVECSEAIAGTDVYGVAPVIICG